MGEIVNCSRCGELYMENTFRDVCPKCAKEEEQMYEIVYKFLRQRENRAATIERVVEVTGVSESLIHKWMKKGRLHAAHFPNLGYPCDRCGAIINKGKICRKCTDDIESELEQIQRQEAFEAKKQEHDKQTTYYAANKRN
ncbi:TIGR03826 family flagellar region protein [Pseudobacillus sp. 179-B 2D1 NHS]|uniref:TIGR03826 family flagellar region protein n=1 Tax=Pseudobacillus sp. 179-B 2D1 NHS TaxID=3374292 RepID=UPI0038795CAE